MKTRKRLYCASILRWVSSSSTAENSVSDSRTLWASASGARVFDRARMDSSVNWSWSDFWAGPSTCSMKIILRAFEAVALARRVRVGPTTVYISWKALGSPTSTRSPAATKKRPFDFLRLFLSSFSKALRSRSGSGSSPRRARIRSRKPRGASDWIFPLEPVGLDRGGGAMQCSSANMEDAGKAVN